MTKEDNVPQYQRDMINDLLDTVNHIMKIDNPLINDRRSGLRKQQSTNHLCNNSYDDNNYDKQGAD